MYIEKALERLPSSQPQSAEELSPEEISAHQARYGRAWKIGQTIFSHAEDDETFWSQFATETSESLLAIGAAGGIFAGIPNEKVTDTIIRSPWVDCDEAEAQITMTNQHGASHGFFGKVFGDRSWDNTWFDLYIRAQGSSEAARYATVNENGHMGLPALHDLRLSPTEHAEAETEALQVLETIATALDAQPIK